MKTLENKALMRICRKDLTVPNFKFIVNNIELDEFPVKVRFDAIIFTELLEHLNFHPVPTLKKLHALLNDNGRNYMSTPDAAEHGKVQEIYNSYKEMPCPKKGSKVIDTHMYQYNKEELFSIIDEAEFKIKRFDYARGLGARHFNLILQKKSFLSKTDGKKWPYTL
jgi:2-polyprenyl-3-methyl-5-hydroxy-6-metoxy-1,4-benzoquinol methylase